MDQEQPARSVLRNPAVPTTLTAVAMWILTLLSAIIFLDAPVPLWVSYAMGAVFLACCFVALFLFFHRAGDYRLPGGRGGAREFAQWDRWQMCLFIWPAIMADLVILAIGRDWGREAGAPSLVDLFFLAIVPLYALIATRLILPGRREGGPDFFTLWRNDHLNDELSREHGRRAFRTGYTFAMLGLAVTVIAAAVAPQWALEAALVAVWLGFVGMSVHFGWLQRQADRVGDE